MYIVAIAWIYVALMVSITQPSALIGIITFVGAGLFPLAIVLYVMGGPHRKRERERRERAGSVEPDQ